LPPHHRQWHTARVPTISGRFFYGYRTPVPVAC
jgi:hypothetical protein